MKTQITQTVRKTSASELKRNGIRVFKHANPGLTGLTIKWSESFRIVVSPTGIQEYRGKFIATANNYRTAEIWVFIGNAGTRVFGVPVK